jgi:hypothetical protein
VCVCVCVSLLQQPLLVDITVHCLLCSRNWVFGEKPEEQSCSDTVRLGVSCWLWSYACYWSSWLGSVMLTVKLHVLLSKLAGECHADCEVTCVTEQTGWCCSPSDLCCKVCSSDLGQFYVVLLWFCSVTRCWCPAITLHNAVITLFGILLMPLSSSRSPDNAVQCSWRHCSTTNTWILCSLTVCVIHFLSNCSNICFMS